MKTTRLMPEEIMAGYYDACDIFFRLAQQVSDNSEALAHIQHAHQYCHKRYRDIGMTLVRLEREWYRQPVGSA